MKWSIHPTELKLKNKWSINGGSVQTKKHPIITVSDDQHTGHGEIALSTKEASNDLIVEQLKRIDFSQFGSQSDIQQSRLHPAIKHGLELALIHYLVDKNNSNISQFFSLKENPSIKTNFSIPILPVDKVANYIEQNSVHHYESCKLKIDGQKPLDFIREVARNYKGTLRIDANECFTTASDCLALINKLHDIQVDFFEQPLGRDNLQESELLKKESPWPIIGDESLQNEDINSFHVTCFDGLNVKLAKAGGPTQALRQIQQCQKLGLKVLVGCMVETSLNISAAMQVGQQADWFDLDGFLLLENDPYELVKNNHGNLTLNPSKGSRS